MAVGEAQGDGFFGAERMFVSARRASAKSSTVKKSASLPAWAPRPNSSQAQPRLFWALVSRRSRGWLVGST